jgi:UDP-glucuronate decarboxylase
MQHSWQRQTVLVTGGAGMLGSHLCEELLKDGHEVLCLDNFYTGNKDNVAHLIGHPHFELIRHDIIQPFEADVDMIYNCACPASPIHYQRDPVFTVRTSVNGVINMLELAKKHEAKLLHCSTSEVYGDPTVHPQQESYWGNVNCTGPRACYDEGKRCAETLCFDYHRQFGTKIKIVRIFNTYGPRMHPDDGRVISNFIMQALHDQPITIYGDGSQTRSFCFVNDLVRGLISYMDNTDDSFVGPMNMGNPVEFTMLELAEKVIQLTGSNSKIEHHPLPQDDPKQRRPDISLAKETLRWEPAVQLEEGLRHTIAYFDNLISRDKAAQNTPSV